MPSVLNDPKLEALLAQLHQTSKDQDAGIARYYREERTGPWTGGMEPRDHAFMADKLVALDPDKAEFCYLLCRAIGARRIFEAGTSFGVSTLYLAAAVRDNGGGTVFGAEYEPDKVRQARANFEAAGLASFVDLREGDVVAAAEHFAGPIDFVLFDIWGDMVGALLEILLPRLRSGAILCADNTGSETNRQGGYAAMFALVDNPANGLRTMTLPFQGGFELTVKL
jgi:predicted O-methyltransferase YrrM